MAQVTEEDSPHRIVGWRRDSTCIKEHRNLTAINDLRLPGRGIRKKGSRRDSIGREMTEDGEESCTACTIWGRPLSDQLWWAKKPPSKWPVSCVKTPKTKATGLEVEGVEAKPGADPSVAREMGKVKSTQPHCSGPMNRHPGLSMRGAPMSGRPRQMTTRSLRAPGSPVMVPTRHTRSVIFPLNLK